MSLVRANQICLSFGAKTVLEDASFCIEGHDRIGLVGPNGTGKSTLLKVLAGKFPLDSGTVSLGKRARVGYLPQDIFELPGGSLLESVLNVVPDRVRLNERLSAIECALEQAEGTVDGESEERYDLAAQLADVHQALATFEEQFGRHQAERILQGLGFKPTDYNRPIEEFSGGWKMRAALAGLLFMRPDLLLLDEPTNHLDIPSLLWFDQFLKKSSQAVVLVCHDRDFLNRQINRVLSFEVEGLRGYSGNYDEYRQQRILEEEELEARARKQAIERAHLESFIERFRAKATKARQVQSRIKLLEKQQIIQVLEKRDTINFSFPEVERSGREVLRYEGVCKSFGQNLIYRDLAQTITRGERVAIIGTNGAGKSTLLKMTAGEISLDSGTISLGHKVRVAYFAQHHTELLDRSRTILEETWSLVPEKPQSWVRAILGAFLFSGDEVDKKIGVLSGGERARVALARLLVLPSNLLLMDEPTNHLDLDSTERLMDALEGYQGTLLFVSHHRGLVNRLATRIWDVREANVFSWPGNLEDYLYHLAQTESAPSYLPESVSPKRESEKERRRREAQDREELAARQRPIKKEIAKLEEQISILEQEQALIEPKMADPQLYQDYAQARALNESYQNNKARLEILYSQWETAQQKLEQ